MTAPPVTASALEELLVGRYRSPDSEIIFEVRNDAGFSASRTCDALAIGLWPSRGCQLQGFEIKVTRADWLRELKQPVKADAFYRYVDHWWIVAPAGVVKDHELPPTWGLLVPHGKTLRAVVSAPRNPDVVPMPRGMLAALVKRAASQNPTRGEIERAREAATKRATAEVEQRFRHQSDEAHARLKRLDSFIAATGIDPSGYVDIEALKRAWALARNGGLVSIGRTVGYAAVEAERAAVELRKLADTLKQERPDATA